MRKSLAVIPEGEFASKKVGAQRPYAYLEAIDVFKLEAALLSANLSVRSAGRTMKSFLRLSAHCWTSLETKHPYSGEDAGHRTVGIPGAKMLLVVLSTNSRGYDPSTNLYVQGRSALGSDRDVQVDSDGRDEQVPETCIMSGESVKNPFLFIPGNVVTFRFSTDNDGPYGGEDPKTKLGYRAFVAAVNHEFDGSDVKTLLKVLLPALEADAETAGREVQEGETVDQILTECKKFSKLEEIKPFLLEIPRWVNLFDPAAARRLVRLVATTLGASQKAARSLNATSGGDSFAHTRRIVTLATSSLRFFCEDALQAILQLMYLVEKRYNTMAPLLQVFA